MKLTDRQREVLRYIAGFQKRCGYSPTQRQIREAFQSRLTTLGTVEVMQELNDAGLIRPAVTLSETARAEVETQYFRLNNETQKFERIG